MFEKSYFNRNTSRTLSKAKMELLVTIFYGSKPYIKVLSEGVPS